MATPPKKMDKLGTEKEVGSEIQNADLLVGAATKTRKIGGCQEVNLIFAI